jgi:hypothetical protein
VQWKGELPGTAHGLLGFEPYDAQAAVDPAHPALARAGRERGRTGLPGFPTFHARGGAFNARAFPSALLTAYPVKLELDPVRALVAAERAAKDKKRAAVKAAVSARGDRDAAALPSETGSSERHEPGPAPSGSQVRATTSLSQQQFNMYT